jgi:hypothetical protein
LLELLDGLFAEELAGEGVEVVAIFHLCDMLVIMLLENY